MRFHHDSGVKLSWRDGFQFFLSWGFNIIGYDNRQSEPDRYATSKCKKTQKATDREKGGKTAFYGAKSGNSAWKSFMFTLSLTLLQTESQTPSSVSALIFLCNCMLALFSLFWFYHYSFSLLRISTFLALWPFSIAGQWRANRDQRYWTDPPDTGMPMLDWCSWLRQKCRWRTNIFTAFQHLVMTWT